MGLKEIKHWFGRSDEDYQDEIREHIDMETQENIDRGMSPEDAARAARVAFGSVSGTRQRLNEGRPGYFWWTLAEDVRYAFRAIRRNLMLSGAVVLTLSVGIGLTTAVFSLINALAFNPPVSVDRDSFVMILGSKITVASAPAYERLRKQVRSVRELAAWSGSFRLSAPLEWTNTGKVDGWLTSCNFFSVFDDEQPRLGRFFQEDDCSTAIPVAVLSERLWRDRFAADSEIVGKSIAYGGHSLTVIGVAVPPKLIDGSAPGLWLPYTLQPSLKEFAVFPIRRDWLHDESFLWLQMAGRLSPGYTRDAADAELKVLMSRELPMPTIQSGDIRVTLGSISSGGIRLTDGSIWTIFPDDVLWLFAVALAFPTLIMLIVCATAATLLLSRAVARQREMAVRLALGGGRRRLIQMLLVENFVLSSAAGALSLVFVVKAPASLMDFLAVANAPPIMVQPDWRVFSYMAVATTLTAVFSGLTPAFESLNAELGQSLKGRETFGRRRGRSLMRHGLVGVQVAFSMVLLVTAATVLLAERRWADPGFETRQVASASLPQSLALDGTAPASLATGVQSLPGVRSVAFSDSIPGLYESSVSLHLPGQSTETVLSADVSAEYFRTLDIPILAGRSFVDSDALAETGEEPVIISQRLADRAFPQRSPLGQILQVSDEERRLRIIGVAGNRTASGTRRADNDGSFVYQRLKPQSSVDILVRFDGNPTFFGRALQTFLKTRTGLVLSASTIEARMEERMGPLRNIEILLLAMGAIGLSLALVGVYGVVSFAATQRKRDFAIRVALGANRSGIFGAVVTAGMRPIPVALLAGVVFSFGALKLIDGQGFLPLGTVSRNPLPYAAAGIVLLLAVFSALLLPAYRVMSSDPVHALREE